MIVLTLNKTRDANLFLDKEGVKAFLEILKNYENLEEDDHDHLQFIDGMVSENKVEGLDFEEKNMADEITIRYRPNMKLIR